MSTPTTPAVSEIPLDVLITDLHQSIADAMSCERALVLGESHLPSGANIAQRRDANLTFTRIISHELARRLSEMHEILYKLAAGAVVRGRCVWCAQAGDPDDGKHTDTCIVERAAALVARHGEAVPS